MELTSLDSVRTNNFSDPDILQKVTALWQRNRPQIIKAHTAGHSVFGVYHHYEGDYHDDYTLSVAITADAAADFNLSQADYRVFVIDDDDDDPEAILHTWQYIWQLEDKGEINRAYSLDLEEYCADGQVIIYIAVTAQNK